MISIKFRGIHRSTNGQTQWIYGLLDMNFKGIYRIKNENMQYPFGVDEETIGQWIGQQDKNKKYIYESDILKDERNDIFVVKRSDGNCGFVAKPINQDRYWPNLNSGTTKDLEVIGNIYDNPNLITEQCNA